jgi:acyl-CoA synthetase (AMP-forming)/AMP-acid ligase II
VSHNESKARLPSKLDPAGTDRGQRFSSLADLLRTRAVDNHSDLAFVFLKDGEVEGEQLTFGELFDRAAATAVQASEFCRPGQRVILLYAAGLEFIVAFFGCILAGVVPVAGTLPQSGRSARRGHSLAKLSAMASDCTASALFTSERTLDLVRSLAAPDEALAPLRCAAITRSAVQPSSALDVAIDSSTLAFIQYTSGSTGAPKGVRVTHGNVLQNAEMIRVAMGHDQRSRFVSWLPLFHDMGLIGSVLQPIYLGVPSALMSPVSFVQSPVRWLEAISRFRGTTSGGPSFAYDLCVQRTTSAQRAKLDLSSWNVAFTGAEPISFDALARFGVAFQASGFRARAIYPCYGMAECTLFATGKPPDSAPATVTVDAASLEYHRVALSRAGRTRTLVSCGKWYLDADVRIVEPLTGRECAPDTVGEIWISGSNVAAGYWGNRELTRASFAASLAGRGRYLRTGDLGFVRDGQLYVTGRLWDTIEYAGRCLYPHDIERTVSLAHPCIRQLGVAVFSLADGGPKERVIVLAEVEVARDTIAAAGHASAQSFAAEVTQQIQTKVTSEHELIIDEVVLVVAGTVRKTSSGKTRRHVCRLDYVLNRVTRWPASSEPAATGRGRESSRERFREFSANK